MAYIYHKGKEGGRRRRRQQAFNIENENVPLVIDNWHHFIWY